MTGSPHSRRHTHIHTEKVSMRTILMTASVGALICSSTALAAIDVIFCEVPGHPKAQVPLGPALAVSTEFDAFDRPFTSPNGQWFLLQAETTLATTEDRILMVFDGTNWSTVLREGLQAPWSAEAETVGFIDPDMGINNSGHFAFCNNTSAKGNPTNNDDYTIGFDGTNFVVLAREGDPAIGGGNWGATQSSPHVLNDGTFCFDSTASSGGSRLLQGNTILAQSTVTVLSNQPGGATNTFSSFTAFFYNSSADGSQTMFRCNLAGVQTIAINNRVALQGGDTIPGMSAPTTNTFVRASMSHNGNWMVRGATTNADLDYVARNGLLVAQGLDPITPGNTELWDDATFAALFFSQYENGVGDYIIGGVTNAADVNANAVLVLNGTTVVVRENDMVDLNGNGLPDDDAFIGVFNNDDLFLTDDLQLYFTADLRDGLGAALGQAFLHIDLAGGPPPCPADINGDGNVNVTDLLAVIGAWGACPGCPADINGDDVVNVTDLLAVIGAWGPCP